MKMKQKFKDFLWLYARPLSWSVIAIVMFIMGFLVLRELINFIVYLLSTIG